MLIEDQKIVVLSKSPSFQISSEYIVYADVNPYNVNVSLAINADSILISVTNLLTTEIGERLNLPEYGVNLPDYLFELMNEDTEWKILIGIFDAINAWEPRVRLDLSKSTITSDVDNHSYNLNLVLHLVGLEDILLQYSGILYKNKSIFSDLYKER